MPNIGRRRESRLHVQLEARMILVDGTVTSALADLSCRGARVVVPGVTARPGQNAVLTWARYEAFGTIVWVRGSQVGLIFDEPLPYRVLMATRSLEDARTQTVSQRLVRDAARAFVQGTRKL